MSNVLSTFSKNYWSDWEGGWCVPSKSHLDFLKFSSTKRPLISLGKKCFVSNLLGTSSRTYIITTPPDLFLSILNGSENSSTESCEFGKESCNFVSVRTKVSTCFRASFFSWLNLLGREFGSWNLEQQTIVKTGFNNFTLHWLFQNVNKWRYKRYVYT